MKKIGKGEKLYIFSLFGVLDGHSPALNKSQNFLKLLFLFGSILLLHLPARSNSWIKFLKGDNQKNDVPKSLLSGSSVFWWYNCTILHPVGKGRGLELTCGPLRIIFWLPAIIFVECYWVVLFRATCTWCSCVSSYWALQGGLLTCAYAVLDYAQTGLIAAVFFFNMMEWWYQSAEERMSAPTVYPPPPKVAKEGIQLPPDRTLCPLCLQKRTNPSVMAVAGFVFCYTCIFKYATQYKRCPVTLMPYNSGSNQETIS